MSRVARATALPILTIGVVLSILLLSRHPNPNATVVSSTSNGSSLNASSFSPLAPVVATPTPALTPTPTPTPIPLPVRVRIPAIGVDAPMTENGVLPNGQVEEPLGPDEVAWTRGGAQPGTVGNAILSGHYDWSIPAPRGAVFFRLSELESGDRVTIYVESGAELTYEVISNTRYLASTAPAEEILAPTPYEIITMITCEGTYDREIRDYSHRRVVVAKRIE